MEPKVNDVLFMNVISGDEKEESKTYKSRITDVHSDTLLIEIPMDEQNGRLKKLIEGDELSMYFISSGGAKNCFDSKVVGFSQDVIRQVVINKPQPSSIHTIQRRNYLRVPAALEIAVIHSELFHITALTEDISGGGLSFQCEENTPVEKNMTLTIWLLIEYKNKSLGHIQCKAQIVRINELETMRKQVMLKFTKISDRDRQEIIRYCFERQIEVRK